METVFWLQEGRYICCRAVTPLSAAQFIHRKLPGQKCYNVDMRQMREFFDPHRKKNGGWLLAKFFSYESKTAQVLARIWDLLLLNFLFLLGSLPILTFGVSAIAAYSVMMKVIEDRDTGIVKEYLRAYRANLKQGMVLSGVTIILIIAVGADFFLFENVNGNPLIFLILGISSLVLFHVHFFYAFALAARYDNTIFRHLTNSRIIFSRFLVRSLICTALVAFEVWLFFFYDWLLLYVGVFIAPMLIIGTKSAFAIKLFHEIEAENGVAEGNQDMSDGDMDDEDLSGEE